MSLETWIEEFYSTSTVELVSINRLIPLNKIAIGMAIQKWSGLTPENLAKHDLHFISCYIVSTEVKTVEEIEQLEKKDVFIVGTTTCHLCALYHIGENSCVECPIMKMKGATCIREYIDSIEQKDPKPMLDLLEKVKENLQ